MEETKRQTLDNEKTEYKFEIVNDQMTFKKHKDKTNSTDLTYHTILNKLTILSYSFDIVGRCNQKLFEHHLISKIKKYNERNNKKEPDHGNREQNPS